MSMQRAIAFWSLPMLVTMALALMGAHASLQPPQVRAYYGYPDPLEFHREFRAMPSVPTYRDDFVSALLQPNGCGTKLGSVRDRIRPPVSSAPPPRSPNPINVRDVPTPTRRSGPYYPASAEALEKEGYAILLINIMPSGVVMNPRVVEESPANYGFAQAAIEGVCQWEFATAEPGVYRVRIAFEM